MYRIQGWCPRNELNGASFIIVLTPEWKEAVAKSGLNQEKMNHLIKNYGNHILKGHHRTEVEDHILHCYLNITWGEWGPEHITVPGNACGLDIDKSCPGLYPGEMALTPHNIDSISQASMILTLFGLVAEVVEFYRTPKKE